MGKTTYKTIILVVFKCMPQVLQTCFCHAYQANKDPIRNIGPDATMYKGRILQEKIHNTWDNALQYD
jgi:hypothetical protein